MGSGRPIHAVIGVRRDGDLTHYLRRSHEMSNYKDVWSLPSIKFDPETIDGIPSVDQAHALFETMSDERLGGVGVRTVAHLTSGSSDMNPMGVDVTLHLYEIALADDPILNPRYYTDQAWMTAEQYERASAGQPCGLCTRLWGDHAWLMGWTDRPFLPRPA